MKEKKKGRFTAPTKVMILEWVLKAFGEMERKLIIESKLFVYL